MGRDTFRRNLGGGIDGAHLHIDSINIELRTGIARVRGKLEIGNAEAQSTRAALCRSDLVSKENGLICHVQFAASVQHLAVQYELWGIVGCKVDVVSFSFAELHVIRCGPWVSRYQSG